MELPSQPQIPASIPTVFSFSSDQCWTLLETWVHLPVFVVQEETGAFLFKDLQSNFVPVESLLQNKYHDEMN